MGRGEYKNFILACGRGDYCFFDNCEWEVEIFFGI